MDKKPILTSIQGNNSELFYECFDLYGKKVSSPIDLTYGRGVFWKSIDEPENLIKNDIDPNRGNVHYDFRNLPEEFNNMFDFLVFDPPYMHSQNYGTVKESISSMYNNNGHYASTMEDVREMYKQAAKNILRIAKHDAIVCVKCMDSIESGKQKRLHIWVYNDFIEAGFLDEDLFVLTTKSTPTIRWTRDQQKHARKNNSYLWVFRVQKN